MIKILGISGSPRREATEYAVQAALAAAKAFDDRIETQYISFKGKKILPCCHCNACVRKKDGRCVLHDDLDDVLQSFLEADGYLIGSPVYTYCPTPQIIAMFNRMRPWRMCFPSDLMIGRVGGAIAVGATRNGGQEITIQIIHNMLLAREILVVGGSSGYYTGGTIWNQNKDAQGAAEDEIGLPSVEDIGRRVARYALMLRDSSGK
ncbi:MAG: flavodoxin family protein [Bacillota bacterium]